jgi:hypothetical protein
MKREPKVFVLFLGDSTTKRVGPYHGTLLLKTRLLARQKEGMLVLADLVDGKWVTGKEGQSQTWHSIATGSLEAVRHVESLFTSGTVELN